jgi:hypothetical protein
LGQLSERLNYDRLYQDALSDPELKRTRIELEVALSNSREAREVVFDLFQDLEGFSLDDYKPFSDVSPAMDRLVAFFSSALASRGQKLLRTADGFFQLSSPDGFEKVTFTIDRDEATSREDVELLGLDHPLVKKELEAWRDLPPEEIGISVSDRDSETALLSIWQIELSSGNNERRSAIQPVAVKIDGGRIPAIEHHYERFFQAPPTKPKLSPAESVDIFSSFVEPALRREIQHRASGSGEGGYSAKLIGYVEIAGVDFPLKQRSDAITQTL